MDLPARAIFILIMVQVVLVTTMGRSFSQPVPLNRLTEAALGERITADAAAVGIYRQGLADILAYMDTRPDIFEPAAESVPSREHKEEMWTTWESFLQYTMALDSIRQYYRDYYRLADGSSRHRAFRVLYAAFLAQYRYALEFLDRCERNPLADTLLNDAVPELGLPPRTYAPFRFRFLNVLRAGEFAALAAIARGFGDHEDGLTAGITRDDAVIWEMGKGRGQAMTARNALRVIRDTAFKAWFPIQAGVSQLMGDIKVARPGIFLISTEQVRDLIPGLQPGDIVLTRREWYASNVGLPGFWSHAALYIGTAAERRRHLGGADVAAWVRDQGEASGELEALLADRYPAARAGALGTDEAGDPMRVIEAVGEGVIFTTAEHGLGADSIVVLRPRLPPVSKARALFRAFHFSGRPYDFNFDFTTDSALVCSELIFKAYRSTDAIPGLDLPLARIAGRPVTPPNAIARLFDAEFGTVARQLDFVAFLDGYEKSGKAVAATEEAFRTSWKRPNWHILLQGETPDGTEDR